MMKNLLSSLLVLVSLTGCMASVDSNQVNAANAVCANHMGLDYFSDFRVICNDSTQFSWSDANDVLVATAVKENVPSPK
jgi:hypothetical protein